MTPVALTAACREKGISVLGSGDALHSGWRTCWERVPFDETVLVVPTAEVEDSDRVHHLILMESFREFGELEALLAPYSRDIATNGRPRVRLRGGEIASMVHGLSGLIGPAHAFTPWTSLYASFDHPSECYDEERPDFVELGLSADSSYAAAIPDLIGLPFLSNSDAHSPDPLRIGREFFGIDLPVRTAGAVLEEIRKGRILMNAGFFPEEGKYNRTACVRCYRQFSLDGAVAHRWKCPDDGGRIKKGVADRVRELSSGTAGTRPPYLHLLPLAQVIQVLEGASSPRIKRVQERYRDLIDRFGNEISILAEIPAAELAEYDQGVARAVRALREGDVVLHPGGGGKYGTFSFRDGVKSGHV
nr:PHP-associated domain-containing protein [Methanolinea mesophila]